jgi:hypothetical protein
MCRLVDSLAVPGDRLWDPVGGLGSHVRARAFVPVLDPSADVGVGCTDRLVRGALELRGGQLVKPALNEVIHELEVGMKCRTTEDGRPAIAGSSGSCEWSCCPGRGAGRDALVARRRSGDCVPGRTGFPPRRGARIRSRLAFELCKADRDVDGEIPLPEPLAGMAQALRDQQLQRTGIDGWLIPGRHAQHINADGLQQRLKRYGIERSREGRTS